MFGITIITSIIAVANAISNGANTTIEEHSYMVAIEYYKSTKCGGAIIAANKILTAATCLYNDDKVAGYIVRAGSTRRLAGGQTVKVKKFFMHPNITTFPAPNYDCAVIILVRDLILGPSVQIIDIATAGSNVPTDTIGNITGWGKLGFYADYSEILQVLQVPKIDDEKCEEFLLYVKPQMVCYGYVGNYTNFMRGDWGGPLVINGVVHGIASWMRRHPYPGAYARISDESINDHIQSCLQSE